MSERRIFCFGDSFTVGEGANLKLQREIEALFNQREQGSEKAAEITAEINKKLSWTEYLAEQFNIHVGNQGESGSNNNVIFNRIFELEAHLGGYTSNDLVIIMWSSSVRNKVPWVPETTSKASPIGMGWSLKELMEATGEKAFTNTYLKGLLDETEKKYVDKHIVPFLSSFFKTYITELHSDEYYNMLNLNYIVFLQEYFKSRNIPYMMIDAFEQMNSFKSKNDKRWDELVDPTYYFGSGKTTLWDELNKIGGNVWEDPELSYSPEGQRCHPNAEGYRIAGELIHNFIKEKIWKPKLL